MTFTKWNNATLSQRELYLKDTGYSFRTKCAMIKKKGEQLSIAARLVINYVTTGNKQEWNT